MNAAIQNDTPQRNLGRLSLTICLGGVILAVFIGFAAFLLRYDARMGAYFVFVTFELVALVIGIIAHRQPLGQAGAIASSVLLLLSMLFLA